MAVSMLEIIRSLSSLTPMRSAMTPPFRTCTGVSINWSQASALLGISIPARRLESSKEDLETGAALGADTANPVITHMHSHECLPAYLRGASLALKQRDMLCAMLEIGQVGLCCVCLMHSKLFCFLHTIRHVPDRPDGAGEYCFICIPSTFQKEHLVKTTLWPRPWHVIFLCIWISSCPYSTWIPVHWLSTFYASGRTVSSSELHCGGPWP